MRAKKKKIECGCIGCRWLEIDECQNFVKCIKYRLYKSSSKLSPAEKKRMGKISANVKKVEDAEELKEKIRASKSQIHKIKAAELDISTTYYMPPLEQSIISTITNCGYEIQNVSIDKQLLNEDTEVVDIVLRVVREIEK